MTGPQAEIGAKRGNALIRRTMNKVGHAMRTLWHERRIVGTAIGVASGVVLLKSQGALQPLELAAFDQLIQMQPQAPLDERVVIVGLDEDDINYFQSVPLPDHVLARVLNNINAQNPRVIGLDIYRNIAQGEGHEQLQAVFQTTPHLIGIEKLGSQDNPGIEPPALLAQNDQIGFNNVIIDPDGRVRRNLLYWTLKETGSEHQSIKRSFALKVALMYLRDQGITSHSSPANYLQLGEAVFPRFEKNDGGYVRVDDGGYQILAHFRHNDRPFPTISLTDVWKGNIPEGLMSDRIVLIGSTAPSLKDNFYIPHSGNLMSKRTNMVTGVELHGHFISQVLSATLAGQGIISVWPDPLEAVWIFSWAVVGAGISWIVRSPSRSGIVLALAASLLGSFCYVSLLAGVWIPLGSPLVALGGSAIAIISHIAHREGELQKSKEFLNSIINTIPDPIFVKDKNFKWVVLNDAYCQFLGLSHAELMQKTEHDVLPTHQARTFQEQDMLTVATGNEQENDGKLTNAHGYTYNITMKRSIHYDRAGNLFLVGVIHDITHRKRMEKKLRRTTIELTRSNAALRRAGATLRKIAYHDPLTGLPNRKLFQERFTQAIAWAQNNDHGVALLFLDLDGFKTINDTLGHLIGDLLLKSVAQRLERCLRESDTVARLGGDEFVVILPGIPENQVDRVAQKILDTLMQPFTLQSNVVNISTSIGISLYPSDDMELDALITMADRAMYCSKKSGKNKYTFAHSASLLNEGKPPSR